MVLFFLAPHSVGHLLTQSWFVFNFDLIFFFSEVQQTPLPTFISTESRTCGTAQLDLALRCWLGFWSATWAVVSWARVRPSWILIYFSPSLPTEYWRNDVPVWHVTGLKWQMLCLKTKSIFSKAMLIMVTNLQYKIQMHNNTCQVSFYTTIVEIYRICKKIKK